MVNIAFAPRGGRIGGEQRVWERGRSGQGSRAAGQAAEGRTTRHILVHGGRLYRNGRGWHVFFFTRRASAIFGVTINGAFL